MARLNELRHQLSELDMQGALLRQRRAILTRAFVREAGGLVEAAALLKLDPRTVVNHQRLDDIAMVVYRNHAGRVDDDDRAYGEVGPDLVAQRNADRCWWRVDKRQRQHIKLLIVIDRGECRRIWPVDPSGHWEPKGDSSTFVALPLGERPLTPDQVRTDFPELGITIGNERPMRQGLMREYIPIDGADPTAVQGAEERER